MPRKTGIYRVESIGGEKVRAFIPRPLPPRNPKLAIDSTTQDLLVCAMSSLHNLSIAGALVPSADWFLYGFVRKEAVISSQIEGTQATMEDVLNFEVTHQSSRRDDVEEICNYVGALTFARKQIASSRGLPLSMRLLCQVHKRLMKGVRGKNKQPGNIRKSQNWIGGTRPGNAAFVPPPPDSVKQCAAALDQWIHSNDSLAPLIRVGLAHAQFETIHPFLDGNGRVGRLLITLLTEHWGLLDAPLLYLSLAFKQSRDLYYQKLTAVRSAGDWEGWINFFLECVRVAADDGVSVAKRLFEVVNKDRHYLVNHKSATVSSIRLLEMLPNNPILTLPSAMDLLGATKPTVSKAIKILEIAGVLNETTGKQRDRVYAYENYLNVLTEDTNNPVN